MPGAIASPAGGTTPAAGVQNNLNPSPTLAPSANAVLNALAQRASVASLNALSEQVNALAQNGGQGSATQRIAATTMIPLDTPGNGKAMPLISGELIAITANLTPVPVGNVEGAVVVADYVSSGAGILILSNFVAKGDAFASEAGRKHRVWYGIVGGDPWAIVAKGGLIDVTAPLIGTPNIDDGARSYIDTPVSEPNGPTLNGNLAGVALTTSTGKTATAVALISGPALRVTLSAPAAYGEAFTLDFAAGMVKDAANNLSAASSSAVSNSILVPLAGADTIANASKTGTTQDVSVTAAGAYTTWRTWQYKLASDSAWSDDATNALTTHSYIGLAPSTSYNYRTLPRNIRGPSTNYSNVLTSSTDAAGRVDSFVRANQAGWGVPSDDGLPWVAVTGTGKIQANEGVAAAVNGSNVMEQQLPGALLVGTLSFTFRGRNTPSDQVVTTFWNENDEINWFLREVDANNRIFVNFRNGNVQIYEIIDNAVYQNPFAGDAWDRGAVSDVMFVMTADLIDVQMRVNGPSAAFTSVVSYAPVLKTNPVNRVWFAAQDLARGPAIKGLVLAP